MRDPRGLQATFKITKTYYVTCSGATEDDCWAEAENLSPTDVKEEDLGDMEVDIVGGFEYDSF